MKTYSEKLRDPRWQKKRLQILERDEWTCQNCDAKDKELHVHHKFYSSSLDVFNYPDQSLITLCFECHAIETEKLNSIKAELPRVLMQAGCDSFTLEMLAKIFGETLNDLKKCEHIILDLWKLSDIYSLNFEQYEKVSAFLTQCYDDSKHSANG